MQSWWPLQDVHGDWPHYCAYLPGYHGWIYRTPQNLHLLALKDINKTANMVDKIKHTSGTLHLGLKGKRPTRILCSHDRLMEHHANSTTKPAHIARMHNAPNIFLTLSTSRYLWSQKIELCNKNAGQADSIMVCGDPIWSLLLDLYQELETITANVLGRQQ